MRDLRRYWQEVRELAATLPEFVRLVSANGCLIEVAANLAARLLLAKSHRIATEDEVRAGAAKDVAKDREATLEGLRKRGIAVVAVRQD
jgi:hypothetical protein